jgi:hypothetical protein
MPSRLSLGTSSGSSEHRQGEFRNRPKGGVSAAATRPPLRRSGTGPHPLKALARHLRCFTVAGCPSLHGQLRRSLNTIPMTGQPDPSYVGGATASRVVGRERGDAPGLEPPCVGVELACE